MEYLILALSGMLATGIYAFFHKRKSRPKIGYGGVLGNCWGDIGGGEEQTTEQSSQTSNIYTDEQKNTLKNILNSSMGLTTGLGTGLEQLLSSALQGDLTKSSLSQLRTGKESNAATYRNLATQSSEALAGRGMLDSGASNKVMSQLQTGEAKANQNLYNQILNNQDANLYKTIASALGLTNLAGSLSTAAQGATGTGTSTTSTPGNLGGIGTMAGAGLGALLFPANPLLGAYVGSAIGGGAGGSIGL